MKHIEIEESKFSSKLFNSLKDTGFAVVRGFDVSEFKLLMDEFYNSWDKFFNDEQLKRSYMYNPEHQSGYFPFNEETAKGFQSPDLKEFFHYYPLKVNDPTDGVTDLLYNKLNTLAIKLLDDIEQHLPYELRSVFSMRLSKMIEGSDRTLLRILNYPALDTWQENSVRAAEHGDINLITLLPASTQIGLQVKDLNGEWHTINAEPGEVIVNVGDMLQEVTRNYLKSTPHRVINVGMNKARLSAPLFLHAKANVKLSNKYTAGEYLDERLKELGLK
jgi:isopenicillin N synthase-like dioxygenase